MGLDCCAAAEAELVFPALHRTLGGINAKCLVHKILMNWLLRA